MALRSALLQRGRVRAWVLCLLAFAPARARAERVDDRIERADEAYRDSNYLEVQSILGGMEEVGSFPTQDERVHGYRLLALSRFYLGHLPEAHDAFFALLKQDPYYELTLEPPRTSAFFTKVREEENTALEPIRQAIQGEQRLIEAEARNRAEADRKADEIRRLKDLQLTLPQVIERHTVQSSYLIALMPFGLGQFQNGRTKWGIAFATTEGAAALASCASLLGIEVMRSPDGTFSSSDFPFAKRFNGAMWISTGLFYALWASGAIEALVNFVPERVIETAVPMPVPPPTARPEPTPTPAPPAPRTWAPPPQISSPAPTLLIPPVAAPIPADLMPVESRPPTVLPAGPQLEQPLPSTSRPSPPHSETLPPPPPDSLHGS